jgi:hypothetical protein
MSKDDFSWVRDLGESENLRAGERFDEAREI